MRQPVIMTAALLALFGCSPADRDTAAPGGSRDDQRVIPVTEVVRTGDRSDLALIDALKAYLPDLMRQRGTPGLNLALARGGQIVWEAGFGWADAHSESPMTPETAFHSGSMGKTYTGTAIMQLVEQGILALDDPINLYLPFEVRSSLGGREITIHDLMTHRSGLSGDAAGSHLEPPPPLAEALEAEYGETHSPMTGKLSERWFAQPGQEWMYSNLGIATLGLIVQQVNPEGLSYSDYVQKNIMDPLGMQFAQYPAVQDEEHVRSDIWERLSTGHMPMGDVWLPTPTIYFSEFPAGGFVAAPADHLRLLLAMMNGGAFEGGRVLQSETAGEMLSPQLELAPGLEQGLIWQLMDRGAPQARFGHDGAHMWGWYNKAVAWQGWETAIVAAVNEWGLPSGTPELFLIEQFVQDWLSVQGRTPGTERHEPSKDWAWKVSYLRGLLTAESVNFALGVPTRLSEADARDLAERAVIDPQASEPGANWNPEAFVQGVLDMNEVDPSFDGIHEFARSERMQITLDEARQAYDEFYFRGLGYASLAGLLSGEQAWERF